MAEESLQAHRLAELVAHRNLWSLFAIVNVVFFAGALQIGKIAVFSEH
jgi:hypothetical protein